MHLFLSWTRTEMLLMDCPALRHRLSGSMKWSWAPSQVGSRRQPHSRVFISSTWIFTPGAGCWMQSIMVNKCCRLLQFSWHTSTPVGYWPYDGFLSFVVLQRLWDSAECHCDKLWMSGCILLCLCMEEVLVYYSYWNWLMINITNSLLDIFTILFNISFEIKFHQFIRSLALEN